MVLCPQNPHGGAMGVGVRKEMRMGMGVRMEMGR